MFLEDCKYVIKEKKMPEYVTNNDEKNSDYSDEENSSEENSFEQVLVSFLRKYF